MTSAHRKSRGKQPMVKPRGRSVQSSVLSPIAAPRTPKEGRVNHVKGFPVLGVWVCLGLVLLNAAIFAPVRHHDFVNWDDDEYVYSNPNIADGLTWDGVVWAS